MKLKLMIILTAILVFTGMLYSTDDFTVTHQYKGDKPITGSFYHALVDDDECLIAAFSRNYVVIFDKDGMKQLASRGQGPNEVDAFWTMFFMKDKLVIEGMAGRMKAFSKKADGIYTEDKVLWKQMQGAHFASRDMLCINEKLYNAGQSTNLLKEKKNYTATYLRLFDKNGKFLEDIISKDKSSFKDEMNMSYYLARNGDLLFLFIENELTAYCVSLGKDEFLRTVPLKVPAFYKKMPDDYYTLMKDITPKQFMLNLEKWRTTYSRITNVLVEGDWLVLQVRTCDEKLKKFALLFYHRKNLKLERTIFTDDLLMAAGNGKYYCFKGGSPLYDEPEETVINIYEFKSEMGSGK